MVAALNPACAHPELGAAATTVLEEGFEAHPVGQRPGPPWIEVSAGRSNVALEAQDHVLSFRGHAQGGQSPVFAELEYTSSALRDLPPKHNYVRVELDFCRAMAQFFVGPSPARRCAPAYPSSRRCRSTPCGWQVAATRPSSTGTDAAPPTPDVTAAPEVNAPAPKPARTAAPEVGDDGPVDPTPLDTSAASADVAASYVGLWKGESSQGLPITIAVDTPGISALEPAGACPRA